MLRSLLSSCLTKAGLELHRTNSKLFSLGYSTYSPQSCHGRRFYNIGAGNFSHPYWTNVDLRTEWYGKIQREAFINFDLMSLGSLPFEANCAEIVYSSHTVEHISDAAAENLFREAYRILKPQGILRLSTPDFDLEHLAYKRGDRLFFYWMVDCPEWPRLYRSNPRSASLHQIFLEHFATQLTELAIAPAPVKYSDNAIANAFSNGCPEEAISRFTEVCAFDPTFPGSHINWWNYRKAERMLRKAGFLNIWRSGYGQSSATVLRDVSLFDNTHPRISLYVEAIKS